MQWWLSSRTRRGTVLATALGASLMGLVWAGPVSATFPGRNGLLAFSVPTGDGAQLYSVDPAGRHLRKLTNVAGSATAVHWSPDARRLVFELDHPNSGSCTIELMNADGSHV